MGLAAVLPAVFIFVSPLLPETPRFLMMVGRDGEALRVLQRVTCGGDLEEAGRVMTELKVSMARQSGRCTVHSPEPRPSVATIRPPRGEVHLRKRSSSHPEPVKVLPSTSSIVLIAVGLGVAQQLTGTLCTSFSTPLQSYPERP
jgi:hypothetical protein